VPRPIREGFEFRDVWFRYPPAEGPSVVGRQSSVAAPAYAVPETDDRWVLRGVSFRIRPGERWALVGENGAGKTTLIKLLLRLYEPTRGEILLDGRPLSAYDPEEYHREVGVIFQDFARFDMRADENIAVGRIGRSPTPPRRPAARSRRRRSARSPPA
jgi:ATP-binding cassette, subfamily B, bacterial